MENKDVNDPSQNILGTSSAAVDLEQNSDKNNHHIISNEFQQMKVAGNLLESTELKETTNQIFNQNQNVGGKNFTFSNLLIFV